MSIQSSIRDRISRLIARSKAQFTDIIIYPCGEFKGKRTLKTVARSNAEFTGYFPAKYDCPEGAPSPEDLLKILETVDGMYGCEDFQRKILSEYVHISLRPVVNPRSGEIVDCRYLLYCDAVGRNDGADVSISFETRQGGHKTVYLDATLIPEWEDRLGVLDI